MGVLNSSYSWYSLSPMCPRRFGSLFDSQAESKLVDGKRNIKISKWVFYLDVIHSKVTAFRKWIKQR
uniref:Uncharacterized protein n=1 Tax=Rhizophora mucronata TaxID=61149 RepID=A0A2P2J6U9_RHIMU